MNIYLIPQISMVWLRPGKLIYGLSSLPTLNYKNLAIILYVFQCSSLVKTNYVYNCHFPQSMIRICSLMLQVQYTQQNLHKYRLIRNSILTQRQTHLYCKGTIIGQTGSVYIVNVPLQCRWVCLYVKMEFHISPYLQRFLL